MVQLGSFEIMLLTNTKIASEVYFHSLLYYNMVCFLVVTMATYGAKGGVDLFFRDLLQGWSMESKRFHGPNMVSCEVVTSGKHTLLIGAHLPPLHPGAPPFSRGGYGSFPGPISHSSWGSQHIHCTGT